MKNILTLILILVICNCSAQNKSPHIDSLSIDFAPSFTYSSKLAIIRYPKFSLLKLVVAGAKADTPYTNVTVKLDNKVTDSLWAFLKKYRFMMKSNVDTVLSKELDRKGNFVKTYHVTFGLDGITVTGKFNARTIRKFAFWSPKKETQNYELMVMVFDLMNNVIKDEKAEPYVEILSGYFNFGLGLKQLSTNPIKYKLYGTISTTEIKSLSLFFAGLPQNRSVLIDVFNVIIAPIVDSVFKAETDLHRNIYWTMPNDGVLANFYRMGIAVDHIISDKKVIRIDTLTEKPVFIKQISPVVKN